jgi:hypothetical protein
VCCQLPLPLNAVSEPQIFAGVIDYLMVSKYEFDSAKGCKGKYQC